MAPGMSAASSDFPSKIDFYAAAGVGVGLFLFFKGFRIYREKLLVADTPVMPARSVAMGLVQVHGVARGDKPFHSPVSGTPYFGYNVMIELSRSDSRGGGNLSHVRSDQNGTRFYLEDPSGDVLVEPRQAELDVPRQCRRQVPHSVMSSLLSRDDDAAFDPASGLPQPRSDGELLQYAGGPGFFGTGRYRFTEFCILPACGYDVLGT